MWKTTINGEICKGTYEYLTGLINQSGLLGNKIERV